jgi:hypothetical protein
MTSRSSCHQSTRIPRRTDKRLLRPSHTPTTLSRERQSITRPLRHGLVGEEGQGGFLRGSGAVEEGCGSGEEDVVESEVKDGGEGLAEGDKGATRAYNATCEDVVPVVDLLGKNKKQSVSGVIH